MGLLDEDNGKPTDGNVKKFKQEIYDALYDQLIVYGY
jgi:hypothetical protein